MKWQICKADMMPYVHSMTQRIYPFLKSFLSQWHPAIFVVDGVEYNCAEQYMMHQKAILFGDEKMAAKILTTDKPHEQKLMGQYVKSFSGEVWAAHKIDIVTRGNYAKFSQNAGLRKKLLATKDMVLAEANAKDILWGIGLSEDDPEVQNPESWKGTNLLGEILMDVRAKLRK